MIKFVTPVLAALALLSAPAAAQTPEWTALVNKAKGQELNLAVHATDGHAQTVDVFKQRFPDIKVNLTVILPSALVPRIVAEQRNNMFAWDSFWGGTSNLVGTLLPTGGIAKIDEYFVLPEVKEPANWNAPQFLYATNEPYIFTHLNYKEVGIFHNSSVVRGLNTGTMDVFLDPRLKGKITIRDPSRPNISTGALAGLVKIRGEDFVRKILTDQSPVIIENARQADDTLLRGDSAILIGGSTDTFQTCAREKACPTVEKLPYGQYVRSLGVIVLKNPPHPDTAKVWINWFLSKDGQQTFVDQWAKYNSAGAVSQRKDVTIPAAHVDTVPDYANMAQYVRISVAEGEAAQKQITDMYAKIKNR